MRLAIACLALLAVAASSRGGCGKAASYEPCAGKGCGAACTACAPGDADCVETAVVKACDPSGACAAAGTFDCPRADACSGKDCGAECVIDPPCRSSIPPCLMPSILGHCDFAGACVQDDVSCPPPPDPCAGKACGDSCNSCGTVPCMTLVATACDRDGACVPLTPWLCYDPCAGKSCGDACQACPPDAIDCAETMCLKSCDAEGQCDCSGSGAACP